MSEEITNVVPITKDFAEPQITDIRKCWGTIRNGIVAILEENPQLTFLPEDVYSECVNGRAMLFLSPVGFVVFTIETDQFTKDDSLLLWLAYTFETGHGNWIQHVEWFEKIARKCGCRFIEARSAVPQMESYALSNGWFLDTRVYVREVQDNG